MALTEDSVYRASTQYRLWSFTPESLSSLRESTNKLASERVVAAIERSRNKADTSGSEPPQDEASTNGTTDPPVDCLTPAEELAILTHYTNQCLKIADALQFPTSVKATAAQYLKRFYLSNSPMTYHPKNISVSCLFLATKTEHHYIALERFAERMNGITGARKKLTAEDVIAPEFVITQGLRFTFDVRHPGRGLRGGLLELLAMCHGNAGLVAGTGKTPQQVREDMLALPFPSSSTTTLPATRTTKDLENRCGLAHEHARELLASTALLTDAYLLYTPSQIWLSALFIADEPLTRFYLSTKFSPDSEHQQTLLVKILSTLRGCAEMLEIAVSAATSREELVRIDKKLYQCLNPEKRDLVGLNAAIKRNGVVEGGEKIVSRGGAVVDEKAAKKRKMEREEAQREGDVFGGALVTGNGSG